MAHEKIQELVSSLQQGELSRRQFMRRAAAIGVSAPAMGALFGTGAGLGGAALAAAQDDSGLLTTNNEQ